MSDPRFTDPHFSDPVLRRDDSVGGMWGWIAGLAAVALVVFLLIAGLNNNSTTAGNNPSATTGTATQPMTPPSTTGQGSTSPRPLMPAPPKTGTQ
jgi:ABC-type phosphate transport system substrate-binding protein